jgi:hypothetical protein
MSNSDMDIPEATAVDVAESDSAAPAADAPMTVTVTQDDLEGDESSSPVNAGGGSIRKLRMMSRAQQSKDA